MGSGSGDAKKAGIPVFLADRDVEVLTRSLFVARISADFNLEGKLAGAWLAQASKGNCQIVELQGTVGSAPAIERKKGFEAVISLFPDMKIVKSQSGDFTTEGGKKVMEAFIKATDNLKGVCGVFAHNDNMQLGAIQAMKEAGLKPGKDFLMVSVDYVPAMKEALAAGDANASVELRSAIGKYIYPVVHGLSERQERAAEVDRHSVRPPRCGDGQVTDLIPTGSSARGARFVPPTVSGPAERAGFRDAACGAASNRPSS